MKKIFTTLLSLLIMISVWGQGISRGDITKNDLKNKNIAQIMQLLTPHLILKELNINKSQHKLIKNANIQDELKQGLDSISYYEGGQLVMRERYTYNHQGNCVLFEELADNAGTVEVYRKTSITYDVNGNMTTYNFFIWSEDLNDWQNRLRTEFSYQNGRISETLLYFYDFDLNELQLLVKDTYNYDAQNHLISIVSTSVWENVWTNAYREDIEYTADGYAYLWTYSNWSDITNDWVADSKEEDFYNDADDLEMNLQSEWMDITSEWIGKYKNEYTYNGNHQMLTDIYSEYEEFSLQWGLMFKDEYTYDVQGNFTTTVSLFWNGDNWEEDSKDDFTFNYDYTFDQILLPLFGEYDFETKNMLTSQKNYDWSGDWQEKGEAILHYSEKDVNSIDELSSSEIQVYPNPSTGLINVSIVGFGQEYTISIIDISGKTIEMSEITNASSEKALNTFDLTRYSKGMYFVKINNSNKNTFQKIIIQ